MNATDQPAARPLSKAQKYMLMLLNHTPPTCRFEHHEWQTNRVTYYKGRRTFILCGSHEHRTAYALQERGLARVFSSQQFGGSGYGVSLPEPTPEPTPEPAAPIEIETETRTVEANGWVDAGAYHTASFRGQQPAGVKGCPMGRSQHSVEAAISDLLHRTNDESGTSYTAADVTVTRHNGKDVPAPAAEPAARTWNESPAFSSLDDSEPYPETEEAAAQSADQLAAIAGRKAAEALDAYAAALDHAATVASDNNRPTHARTFRNRSQYYHEQARAARTDAARLA